MRTALVAAFAAVLFALNATPVHAQAVNTFSPDTEQEWQQDKDVTAAGKFIARTSYTLDWALKNYQWQYIDPAKGKPFSPIWSSVRNIVYGVMLLFILAGAMILIITRGASVTARKFIPTFIFVLILVTLSYSLVQFIYSMADVSQGFFLRAPTGQFIQSKDLLNSSVQYKEFVGFRRVGDEYDEAVLVNIWLMRITAGAYYAMFTILMIRKIILWFFLVVSPIFPLLLFFPLIRNTAKIWLGQFFRWVLYGPLFAVFLSGTVVIWNNQIPQNFSDDANNADIFPVATNLLIGAAKVEITPQASINTTNSYVQYLVSLLMLLAAVVMPWLLLKIFLDYVHNLAVNDNTLVKLLAHNATQINGGGKNESTSTSIKASGASFMPFRASQPPPSPHGGGGAGMAVGRGVTNQPGAVVHPAVANGVQKTMGLFSSFNKSLDSKLEQFGRKGASILSPLTAAQKTLNSGLDSKLASLSHATENDQILKLANIKIPSMHDIAKLEMAGPGGSKHEEVFKTKESLQRLSGDSPIMAPQEREHMSEVRKSITQKAAGGNTFAKRVVEAFVPAGQVQLPDQGTSPSKEKEEFEKIQKSWKENYQHAKPPHASGNETHDRVAWLQREVSSLSDVVGQLISDDNSQVIKGKEAISDTLPLFVLAGFNKADIIEYIKAKIEAAKNVLKELTHKTDQESAENLNKVGEEHGGLVVHSGDNEIEGETLPDVGRKD